VALAAALCWAVASGAEEPSAEAKASPGASAVKQAAAANKHLYLFFYSEDDQATQTVRKSFEAVMAKMTGVAQWIALRRDDPAEGALADRFQLQTFPMPLVVVLAPNGVVAGGGLAEYMPEEKLRAAIASPCQQRFLKALQEKKAVVLCAYDKNVTSDDPAMKAVSEFKADAANAGAVEVVRIDPADAAEAGFLKQLEVDPKGGLTTIILAPGQVLLGKLSGPVTKEMLTAALKSAGWG